MRYENGVHGEPRLEPDLPSLEFNLYHSDGLGLVAVARDRSLRVDGEQVRDVPHVLSIAAAHFSAAEREVLRPLPPAERRSAFFRCWTREEAVIKAVGEGLGRALDSFDVDLAPGSTSVLSRFDRATWRRGRMVVARCDGAVGTRPPALSSLCAPRQRAGDRCRSVLPRRWTLRP